MKARDIFLLFSIGLISLFSCNKGLADVENPVQAEEIAFLAGEAPAALTKAEEGYVTQVNDFSLAFAGEVFAQESGSFVISPVSLAYVLGLLAEGADGQTRQEITSALGFGADDPEAVNRFCRDLMVLSSQADAQQVQVEIGNAVMTDASFSLSESFRRAARGYYDADLLSLDFSGSEALRRINAWASERTHGHVPTVLHEVPAGAQAVFLNTLYLNASWGEVFENDNTVVSAFHPESGNARKESMMRGIRERGASFYAENETFQVAELPLGAERVEEAGYSMIFVLPRTGVSLEKALQALSETGWTAVMQTLRSTPMDIRLPKMDVRTDKQLNDILPALGIRSMFQDADFSRLSSQAFRVSLAKQVVSLTVNEEGVEGAAATAISMETDSPDVPVITFVPFYADHPFLFAVRERTTGALLYLGCYR